MNTENTYRPANIEFDVENPSRVVPDNLGFFENSQKATEFIARNMVGINYKISVNRFMDNYEKQQIRKEYIDILENKLPMVKRNLTKALTLFNEAKSALGDAKELVKATSFEAESLAMRVKEGIMDMKLDDQFTWRVPYDGKYYYFTYMDRQLKLCKVQDIPAHEKQDLYNAMHRNDVFFNEKLGVKDLPEDPIMAYFPNGVDKPSVIESMNLEPVHVPFEGGITVIDSDEFIAKAEPEDDLPIVYNSDEDFEEEDPLKEDDEYPPFNLED